MKTLITIILVLLIRTGTCISCSFFCELPTKLDKNTFIGEGKIVGYRGNYSHPDVPGEIGLVEISITNWIYTHKKSSKIYISVFFFGNSCEEEGYSEKDLMANYPLNQVVSFVGEKLNILSDSILHIGICHCCPVFLGSIENRIRYDYESHRRKMYSEFLFQIEMSFREGYWVNDKYMEKKIRDTEKAFNDLYVPEKMQVYLDIVEITLAKTRESRFYILQRLIWSRYVGSPKFIKRQNISAKQKSILLSEMNNINEKWSTYFKKED